MVVIGEIIVVVVGNIVVVVGGMVAVVVVGEITFPGILVVAGYILSSAVPTILRVKLCSPGQRPGTVSILIFG